MRRFALASSVVFTLVAQTWADDIPQFGMLEKSFRHLGTYDNSYKDLTAVATLRRPDGKEWRMPLFWDGEAAWMLRVSPDLVGEWSYSIHSSDVGLNAKTGSFRCVESNRHGSIRPMRDHPLHFEYQDGTPCLVLRREGLAGLPDGRCREARPRQRHASCGRSRRTGIQLPAHGAGRHRRLDLGRQRRGRDVPRRRQGGHQPRILSGGR